MGVPDDLFHWYLTEKGSVSGDENASPLGALARIVFRSPNNNPYSTAYWEASTDLVTDKDAIRAAMKKFGSRPKRPF